LDHSDHSVTVQLPADFAAGSGAVTGQTQAKLLTEADLAHWADWLREIPPVPDAALYELGIAPPPLAAG
jgi:hypothetical protein